MSESIKEEAKRVNISEPFMTWFLFMTFRELHIFFTA